MCPHCSEQIELARINLAYAKAEIFHYGDGSDLMERLLHHVQEADLGLASISCDTFATACKPTDPEEQG
jgi:hypothetical protein